MFESLFRRRAQKSNNVSLPMLAEILSQMPDDADLETRLDILVNNLANLPEHTGAMLVAFDGQGQPFCYRSRGISLIGDASAYSTLLRLRQIQLDETYQGSNWTTASPEIVQAPRAAEIMTRFLRSADRELSRGMILIANRFKKSSLQPPISDQALTFLEWTLRDSIRLDSMKLQADLHKLAAARLSIEQLPIDSQRIAEDLRLILRADAVTLLVNQLDQHFLAATTDKELQSTGESFNIDQDLTTLAMETCQPIRLRNATDAEEIKHLTSSTKAIKAEDIESLTQTNNPYRLLVVPMRSRRESQDSKMYKEAITGAIRILRGIERRPFTLEEEEALQGFADLLGAELDASWLLQIYGHIRRGTTEAICISRSSRQQLQRNKKDPIFVYANPGAQNLFGLSSPEIIGQSVRKFYPNDAEYERIRLLLMNAKSEGLTEYGPIESRVRAATGRVTPVTVSFRFIAPDVQPAAHYTISVIRDISLLYRMVQQRNQLMALLDKQGLAYFLADEDGKTITPTETDSRLTGYSKRELEKMQREKFYADPERRQSLLRKAREANGDLVRTLQRLRRKDGEVFFAEGVIHVLKDYDGEFIGYEGLYEDVTNRIRLQGFLDANTDRVLKEAELFERLKENAEFHLLYTKCLCHQLRAPIGAILHTLFNMRERFSNDEKWDRRLRYAIGQAQTWRRLIENLAFMDRLLRGDDFPFEPINLARLAIETKVDFQHVLPEKRLRFHVNDSSIDRLLGGIWGNDALFRQALVNLVDNAIKYSHPGTEIQVRGYDAAMQGRVLEVSNQGVRVPREERSNIFLRGYRTMQARDSVPDSFGIGLWLVHKIVQAHGGSIRCDETPEKRTAFRIYFPNEPMKHSVRIGG